MILLLHTLIMMVMCGTDWAVVPSWRRMCQQSMPPWLHVWHLAHWRWLHLYLSHWLQGHGLHRRYWRMPGRSPLWAQRHLCEHARILQVSACFSLPPLYYVLLLCQSDNLDHCSLLSHSMISIITVQYSFLLRRFIHLFFLEPPSFLYRVVMDIKSFIVFTSVGWQGTQVGKLTKSG